MASAKEGEYGPGRPGGLNEGRSGRKDGWEKKGLIATNTLPSGPPPFTPTLQSTPPDNRPDGDGVNPTKTI